MDDSRKGTFFAVKESLALAEMPTAKPVQRTLP